MASHELYIHVKGSKIIKWLKKWCTLRTGICLCWCVRQHRTHPQNPTRKKKKKRKTKTNAPDWFRPTSRNYELKHKSEIFILLKRDSSVVAFFSFPLVCTASLCSCSLLVPFLVQLSRFVNVNFLFFSYSLVIFEPVATNTAEKLSVKRNIWFTARVFFFSTAHIHTHIQR